MRLPVPGPVQGAETWNLKKDSLSYVDNHQKLIFKFFFRHSQQYGMVWGQI